MGNHIFVFILMIHFFYLLIIHWRLYRKISHLHSDVREFDKQQKMIIQSLEKKICMHEMDVGEIKNDFKEIQTKIISFNAHII